jgi:hypothetical protein
LAIFSQKHPATAPDLLDGEGEINPMITLTVRAYDDGIPSLSAEVPVHIFTEDVSSRMMRFIVPQGKLARLCQKNPEKIAFMSINGDRLARLCRKNRDKLARLRRNKFARLCRKNRDKLARLRRKNRDKLARLRRNKFVIS